MDTKMVSVIVPVYNVERYLNECIESLVKQTYKNIEIILIDDNSTDGSLQICKSAASKDSRIKVINKVNGGAASARNVGLDNRLGEYVCFVDSDDYVCERYIELLVKNLESNDADVAVCGFWYLYNNYIERKGYQGPDMTMSQVEYLKCFLNDWTCGLIWNKIFRTEVVGKIRFPEGHKIDDEFFTYQLIMNSSKIFMFSEPLYLYRMRASSVMNSSSEYLDQILLDKIQYLQERYDAVGRKYPELKEDFLIDLADSLIRYYRESLVIPNMESTLKEVINKYKKEILFSRIGLKKKYSFFRGITKYKIKDQEKQQEEKSIGHLFD